MKALLLALLIFIGCTSTESTDKYTIDCTKQHPIIHCYVYSDIRAKATFRFNVDNEIKSFTYNLSVGNNDFDFYLWTCPGKFSFIDKEYQ